MANKAPALENGLTIIELVAEKKAIGFNQIKTELSINPASLTRYINTLVDKKFLKKDANKQYVLGDNLLGLLSDNKPQKGILDIIQPILENVSDSLGCTAQYMSFEDGRIVCRAKYMHKAGLVLQNIGESRTDYIIHPWGFIYLTNLDKRKRSVVIANSNVKDDMKDCIPDKFFLEELIHAASEGYSDDLGKMYKGIRRLAAPVYKDEQLIGAIAVGLVGTTLEDNEKSVIKDVLISKAKQLSEALN